MTEEENRQIWESHLFRESNLDFPQEGSAYYARKIHKIIEENGWPWEAKYLSSAWNSYKAMHRRAPIKPRLTVKDFILLREMKISL